MSDLILHHYPTSPFSEKVRLILGYKKLAWKSVVVPPIMPKPDVVALTGGYRKTPFLQIGADIYCDTALICDILEHRQPTPALYPAHNKGLARVLAQWADSTLFWTAMAYNFSPAGAAQVFPGATPESMKAFAEDRAKMRVAVPRMPPPDAAAACKSYLRRLANMLEEQPFLLGAAPCIADFAAYHPLWFTRHRTPAMAGILSATPGVLAWMDSMAALGHHDEQAFSAVDAIALAAASTPAPLKEEPFQDEHGMALGSQVTVFSDSFGPEPTQGELIAATRMHYTLRRSDERAGTVHVHFPRIGYILKKATTA
ncbi:MAG: glutathione S-transferase family protein [Burkholderiaceae bacterium]|jgi:glutathione S-transferase|nr:MAG: glutathione S-transferase family protein [Burkholderiaceae bacterium]TBR74228.1 MAG: glutathione S-transferase family protein [Burkholderiaceae bacterium]